MTMGVPAPFSRVAVLGTGLIGGSFALAVRQHFPEVEIAGWDRAEVLEQARARGAITQGSTELTAVLRGAELVYLALPVGMILEMLPAVARGVEPAALVTDAGSTKAAILRLARAVFRKEAHTPYFVGGHPLAGKETSGIAHADPELFRGAKYALIGSGENIDERVARLLRLLETLGAVPVWMDAETHDWAVAIISHLPQMAAVALARVVADETDETGLPLSLAGRGLREALRLAGSPYEIWRDIALTNTDNLARALDRLAQAVDHLRTRLATHELREEFEAANEVYKILRQFE
jgi:prephenate dehydrogenase